MSGNTFTHGTFARTSQNNAKRNTATNNKHNNSSQNTLSASTLRNGKAFPTSRHQPTAITTTTGAHHPPNATPTKRNLLCTSTRRTTSHVSCPVPRTTQRVRTHGVPQRPYTTAASRVRAEGALALATGRMKSAARTSYRALRDEWKEFGGHRHPRGHDGALAVRALAGAANGTQPAGGHQQRLEGRLRWEGRRRCRRHLERRRRPRGRRECRPGGRAGPSLGGLAHGGEEGRA